MVQNLLEKIYQNDLNINFPLKIYFMTLYSVFEYFVYNSSNL